MTEVLKYRLLENGIDSIIYGCEEFMKGHNEKRYLKFAVLHIFHGLELILKEKLGRINGKLLYTDQGTKSDSYVVGFKETCKRLETAGVSFTEDSANLCRQIQAERNRIEHKDVCLEVADTKRMVGRVVEFLVFFMRGQLGVELQTYVGPDDYALLMIACKSHKERLRVAKDQNGSLLRKYPGLYEELDCPACLNRTVLALREGECECTCAYCLQNLNLWGCERCGDHVFFDEDDSGDRYLCDDCSRNTE